MLGRNNEFRRLRNNRNRASLITLIGGIGFFLVVLLSQTSIGHVVSETGDVVLTSTAEIGYWVGTIMSGLMIAFGGSAACYYNLRLNDLLEVSGITAESENRLEKELTQAMRERGLPSESALSYISPALTDNFLLTLMDDPVSLIPGDSNVYNKATIDQWKKQKADHQKLRSTSGVEVSDAVPNATFRTLNNDLLKEWSDDKNKYVYDSKKHTVTYAKQFDEKIRAAKDGERPLVAADLKASEALRDQLITALLKANVPLFISEKGRIRIPDEIIPQGFLDPVTREFINRPVTRLDSDGRQCRCYDQSTPLLKGEKVIDTVNRNLDDLLNDYVRRWKTGLMIWNNVNCTLTSIYQPYQEVSIVIDNQKSKQDDPRDVAAGIELASKSPTKESVSTTSSQMLHGLFTTPPATSQATKLPSEPPAPTNPPRSPGPSRGKDSS